MNRFGHNLGFVDELFRAYRADPTSVSRAWREFFMDYRPDPGTDTSREAATAGATGGASPSGDEAEPLRGIAARIVENMTTSLEVPTATSARTIPVKMLEENRRIINHHQSIVAGSRVSFTHLIAWAVVRALAIHPRMNDTFASIENRPHRVRRDGIHLGLAVDIERGEKRILLVPNIKEVDRLDFPAFVAAYNDLVRRARNDELTVDDFQGTTVTLTNPGMLGTVLSVPRLMRDQGAILGVGSIGLPAEYSGMAPEMVSELGLSKVMTVTSTYDHRVIQGAESGQFLLTLERMFQGDDSFYSRVFTELGVPREPIAWSGDRNPKLLGGAATTEAIAKQAGVLQLIRSYRVRGHLWADLDPLGYSPEPNPELELSTYGLTVWDLDRPFIAGGLGGNPGTAKLREILETLQHTYCRHVGVEFMHIQDTESRHWIQETLEQPASREPLPRDLQIRILKRLNAAEAFETFLHTNYVGQKRFSLEGAETLIPMLDILLHDAIEAGIEQAVVGLAHRGRLNVLAHIVGKSYGQIFREFEGLDPDSALGSGDVKYHLGANGTFENAGGRTIHVRVASNPSHLEAVNPVVEGMARALQDTSGDTDRARVLPILIHGDAAFAGQGVVAETLNLSELKGYRTGGTVHVVVNNQIGFTTGPADARSSTYPTDVAKMVRAPIFHVNGDRPEDAVRVMRHALAFRQAFRRDVVVDLFCYRRWGHNEADDPSYTHPILYSKIEGHRSVRKLYTEQLLRRGDFDIATAEKALEDYRDRLHEVHDEVRRAQREPAPVEAPRSGVAAAPARPRSPAVEPATLRRVLDGLTRVPSSFEVHPKLSPQLARRRERFEAGRIDWALAESLAFGSLVLEGTPVRLSGEDTGRGTFSQRHAILYDHRSAERFVPLSHLAPEQAAFTVFDSLLSEFAVLGFEYGYSVADPASLVLWEAQFGDFVNGAQVIIDQFICAAEEKWGQPCRLVLLLPHGHEGQGPEHSSARPERFLQLAAGSNLQVANPTTPAQYFHLLREQMIAANPRPLVVMTPKSLLRLPACVSSREELSVGTFTPVKVDANTEAGAEVHKILLCSGKIYYDLAEALRHRGGGQVLLCRLERLHPFPAEELRAILELHTAARKLVWVQEEPENMGSWGYLERRLRELAGRERTVSYVGRPEAASPATGSFKRHVAEQDDLIRSALD